MTSITLKPKSTNQFVYANAEMMINNLSDGMICLYSQSLATNLLYNPNHVPTKFRL